MALNTLLDRHATYHANDLAIIFEDERLTWSELRGRVDSLIRGLHELGLGKGDRIAMLLDNSMSVIELYHAAAKGGFVVVPLSPLLRGKGLTTLINDSDALAVVTTDHVTSHLDAVRSDLVDVADSHFFVVGDPVDDYRPFDQLYVAGDGDVAPNTDLNDEDVYNIIYSSGTTGLPKGIVHTHGVREAYCTGFAASYRIAPDSVIIHSGSLVFNGSFLTLMPWMFTGCTFVLMRGFDATEVLDLMESEGVTHSMLVPSQIVQLLEDERFTLDELPSAEMLCSVGAPLLLEHKHELVNRFPDQCYELYGLTEGFVTVLDRDDFLRKAGSVGVPPPLYEMVILDDDGNEVAVGEVGEICGRGPITMPGYYKRPDLTAETMRDGWLHTGDLGHVDDDGFLFLVDRKKDLIISGGVNIYPRDVEETVIAHPAVKDVAVFGIPHPTWGEQPIAAVVLREEVDPTSIKDWVNARVEARYQRIGDVTVVDELPLSVAGKTLRRVVRDEYDKKRKIGNRDRFIETNGITIHCLDHPGDGPTLILLPGLTANAHSFGGLVDAGLSPALHVLALDLRGRGLSDHPDAAYTIQDHAADVVGLMDALGLDQVILGGHSFGGMLTYYLGARYPDRFSKLVTIDAPAEVDPVVAAQIKPSLDRLGKSAPSWEAYLAAVRAQPYFDGWWDPKIEEYYRADVKDNPDGTVQSRSRSEDMQAVVDGTLAFDWPVVVALVTQPVLVIRALDPYGPPGSPPILPKDKADQVIELLADPSPVAISGNHMTILFGERAGHLVDLIVEFAAAPT